jgi:hypothetical protein
MYELSKELLGSLKTLYIRGQQWSAHDLGLNEDKFT